MNSVFHAGLVVHILLFEEGRRTGLPFLILSRLGEAVVADERAWLAAVASAVEQSCG